MNALLAKLRISHKTILFLLIFILIPLIALAISITLIDNKSLQSSVNEPLQALTCSQLATTDEKIRAINYLVNQIADIDNIQTLSSLNSSQRGNLEERVQQILSSNQYGLLAGIDIIFRDSTHIHFGQQDYQLTTDVLTSLESQISNDDIFQTNIDDNFVSLKKLGTGQDQTLLALYISNQFLTSDFSILSNNYSYYLLSENNQVIVKSEPTSSTFQLDEILDYLPKNGNISQNEIQATICTNPNSWKLILITPENFSIANNNLLFNIFLIVILIDAIFTLLIALLVDRKLLVPIKKITGQLRRLNNEETDIFKSLNQESFSGEIRDLIIEYNQLIENQTYTRERDLILNEKSDRFETAIQGSKIGVWDWNLETNHCYYSSSWRKIIGHTEESMHNLPTEWFTRVHPEDIEALKANISNYIDGKTSFFEHDHRLLHLNNTYIWVQAKGIVKMDDGGNAIRLIGTLENIANRKSLEFKLMAEAMYDPLTGLPNRTYFSGVIDQSLARIHRREDYHSAVLYIDLDRFKSINDNFSFAAGNALLQEITLRLKYSLRSMDTIGRLNDDKFVVLLEEINGLPDALKIIHRLNKEISKPFIFSGSTIYTAASIGIVMLSRGYQEANEVLRDAESALFQAKSDGRGKFEIYDKEIYSYTLSKIRIENDLKLALKNKEFSLFIQPVIDTRTKRVVYADTNLYWHHPEKGFIPRSQYYNIAEEGGEIIALDHYLLRNACSLANEWVLNGHKDIILTIPISSKMILHPDFTEKVLSALADSSLPNESLQLAITETSKIYSSGIAVQAMVNLSSIGVKFCLAEFGVIPSSLEQLKRLPIHTIKLSDTLIRDLPKNSEDAAITEAIISMAKILGYKLISSGVDTQEQAEFLVQKGIELIAGDFYSKPLDANEFNQLIAEEIDKS